MAYSSVAKKMKNRNPRADPDHNQKSTNSRVEGHLLPMPAKFGRRPFPRSSVILFTEYRMTERMKEWQGTIT